jgi:hypothetical protein
MQCDSERLRALQRVFETACMEMEPSPVVREPAMRDEIARMVFDLANCELTDDEIVTTVAERIDRQLGRGKPAIGRDNRLMNPALWP